MRKYRRRVTTDQAGQTDLTPGGREQILPANDERHSRRRIVDRSDALVGPVAQTIPQQQISALRRRVLFLTANERIVEHLDPGIELQPPADVTVLERYVLIAARPGISALRERTVDGIGRRARP